MVAAALFILFAVVPASLSSPLDWDRQNDGRLPSDQCSDHCTASSKFLYEPDKTYEYNYEVLTTTSMHGASADRAQISVTSEVNIHVVSKCEMVLTLSNVVIKRSSPETSRMAEVDDWTFKLALERNSLRFSFQDGLVNDLCPSDQEEVRSLNFKRGVLSAFQNSMGQHVQRESMREIDVTGACPTEYSIHQKGWKATQFTKVKDLLGCSDRHHFTTALQATPFRAPDAIQSLPLLKGNHKCDQTVTKQGQVTSNQCVESLVFRPFSRKEAGARTHTSQTLTLVNTRTAGRVRTADVTRRTSLVFEHEMDTTSDDQTLYATREKLAELCRLTLEDIPSVTPSLFTDMVYLMRRLTGREFMAIAEGVHRGNICDNNKDRARKFFNDAIPMVGTSASVQVMVELLLSGEVKGVDAQLWLKSLHFLPEPTEDMIVHAKRLVLSDDLQMSSLLPVTTLVSHYCKIEPDCSSNDNVRQVSGAIQTILAGDCQSSQHDLVLMALRSVGNLGFSDHLVSSLEKCAKNEDLSINMRVTALQAYRGVTCATTRLTPMEIFLDKGEDSELRIAAYLAVMECPFQNVLARVKQQLEREEVNQVGSFVWTHLTNLQETSVLHKQAVRDILEDEQLKKAFDLDKRKFSRNYELSYFSQGFGLGGSAESNLIWSEKSFIPRSAMLNITVDILGHTVNLLEIGGRVQGVEGLLQEVIGNSAFFKGGVPAPRKGRNSRCAKQNKLKQMKEKFGVDKDEMTASLYVRLFGNDFGYKHFSENELTGISDDLQMGDIFKSLSKGRELSWTQSALFMDSTMHTPTVAGMALALSVNGSATMDLRAQGKMDLQKISLKKMVASLDVRPSAAVQFSGRMSLGLGSTQVGLKMVTILHSSTAFSSSIDLKDGQVLVVEMDTPKRQMDILNVKSEFFIQHDKEDNVLEMNKGQEVRRNSCSREQIVQVLGYEACAEVSFVRTRQDENTPYYPFTGASTLSLTVNKKDAPRGFKFIGKQIKNERSALGLLSIDTPGSTMDRALNVGFSVDTEAHSAEVEFNSPWTDLLAKGAYTVEDKEKKFTGTVRLDGREHSLMMKWQEETENKKRVWTSVVELEKPENSMLIPGGPRKFSINSRLEKSETEISAQSTIITGLKPNHVELKMKLVNKKDQKSLSGSATVEHRDVYSGTVDLLHSPNWNGARNIKLKPTVLISAPNWKVFEFSGDMEYKPNKLIKANTVISMDKFLKKPIKLDTKVNKQAKKQGDIYVGNLILNSQFANVKLNGNVRNRKKKVTTSKLRVDYTIPLIKNRKYRKNKLNFNAKVHDRSTKSITKYDVSLNSVNKGHPDSSFTSKAQFSHKSAFTRAGATLSFGPKKKNPKDKTNEIRTNIDVDHKLGTNHAVVEYNAAFIYPLRAMEYEIQGKHEHHLKDEPKFETYVTTIIERGKSAELRISGINKGENGKVDMRGAMNMVLPPFIMEGREIAESRYSLTTTLKQNKKKEYVHTVNMQLDKRWKHSVVSTLQTPTARKPTEFEFNSKVDLDLENPTSLILKASNGAKNAVISSEFVDGMKSYTAEVASSYQDKNYQTVTWDITVPERHIKGKLEGGKRGEMEGGMKLVSYWDADRDESKKIESEIYNAFANEPDFHSESLFTLTTPFKGHRQYMFSALAQVTEKRLKEERKIVWREPGNELSYSIDMLLPPTANRFEVQAQIKTPFEQLKLGSVDVAHKWDGSRHLSTTVEAAYNDDNIKTVLLSSDTGNSIRRIISRSLAVTSTVPEISDLLLKFEHEDDGHIFGSEALCRYNGRTYRTTMNATYIRVEYQMTTNAKVQIELPSDRPITITWVHSNTLIHLNSTLELQWHPEYNTKVVVGAKGSQAEKDYAVDVKVIAPGKRRQNEFDLELRQNMMTGYQGSAHWTLDSMPELETTVSYSFSDKAFDVVFTGVGRESEIRTHYEDQPYTALVRTTWRSERGGQDHTILFDASMNVQEDDLSANAKLVTPWEGARNIDAQGSLKKATDMKWELDSSISLGVRRHITANVNVATDGSSFRGEIKTPFEEMAKMEIDWNHNQDDETTTNQAHIELQPYFNKITVEHSTSLSGESNIDSRLFLGLPDTDIKSLEMIFDNKEHRRGHNSNLKVKYLMGQEIDLSVRSRFNAKKFPDKSKIHIDLSTPFNEFPNLKVKAELDRKGGKWNGLFDLKTGSEALEDLTLTFEHAQETTSSITDVELSSSVFETVTAGAHFDWGPSARANVTFVAPSVGRTSVGFVKRSESWTDFQNKIFAEFDNSKLDLEVGLKHEEDETRGWFVYSLPTSEHSFIKANIHKLGSDFNDMDVGGYLQLGRDNKPYNISAQYAYVPNKKYALGTTFETPITEGVSYLYEVDMSKPQTYSGIIYTKYGRDFLLDLKSSQKIGTSELEQSAQAMYRLGPKIMRIGSSLSSKWSKDQQTATLVSYKDDHTVTVDFSREAEDIGKKYKEKIELGVNTPFKGFTDVGLHATYNNEKDGAKHGGKVNLEYMDSKEAEITFNLRTPNKNRADLTAELIIPVKGYKKNRLTYNHVFREESLNANAMVVTGQGHRLEGDLDYKDQELTFTVNGPVNDFESLAVNGKYDTQQKRLTGDASYQLRTIRNPVSLKYDIVLKGKPVTLDFELTNVAGKLTTLHVEHDGSQLRYFNNIVDLKSEAEQLNNVRIETFWQLRSPNDFELRSEMTSNHPDYDRAALKFNTQKQFEEQLSELHLEWSPERKIYLSNGFTLDVSTEPPPAIVTFTLNTPWEELEEVYLQFSHKPTQKKIEENVMLRHNKRNLLDANFVFSSPNNRHRAVLTFKKPEPMMFSVEGEVADGMFDGRLNMDWDKDSPVGRVEIVSSFSDKSTREDLDKEFKFKVNHPVRILGVDLVYKASQKEFRSAGLYTWDEARGNTFSYDLGWANRSTRYSRMFEGHAKLGIPQRSVKYQGSYSDTGRAVTTTSTVNWHADHDETKKVTMTTTVEENDNFKRVDLNINIPYINKQLNLGATTKGGYGHNLLDTKAEISYSSDPRKTITVTSLVSNSIPESSGEGYNYTLDLGFQHPVSGIDLALVSHVANANEVISAGSDFSFENVNGRRQNVNFFTKMDNRNQRFEIVVSSPMKSLGVRGQATSARQGRTLVQAVAFEDGNEALKLGMVIDPKKRHVDVEFNYDRDDPKKLLSLSGGFVNDSALTLDVTTQASRRAPAQTETLIAVRLNSSQLLHTRIQWRPNVDDEIRQFLGTRLTEFSYETSDFLKQAVQVVGQEVKGKYLLVSEELKTELTPVFDLMEKEMDSLNAQLNTLWVKIRRFHQQNHMHIKDMGDQIAKAFQEFNEGMVRMVHNYRIYYNKVNEATQEWLEHLSSFPIARAYQAFIKDAGYMLKEVESALDELLSVVVSEVGRLANEYYLQYMKLSRKIDRKLDSYAQSVHELPLYRKMVEQRAVFGKNVSDLAHWLDTVYMESQELLQDQYQDIMARDEFKHMFAVVNEVIGQLKHYNKESSLGTAMHRVSEMTKNLLLIELAKLKKTIMDFRKSRVIVYDPQRGELQVEMYLPIPLKSLYETPEFKPERYLTHAQRLVQSQVEKMSKMLPDSNSSLWDLYYDHVPSTNPSDWVPPYDASAYLIGSQHIITFDKHEYDFLSKCSHVLAHDTLKDSFSVVVNYSRRPKRVGIKSLCFTIEDIHVEVFRDYKITVNSQAAEMPFTSDKVKVMREGDFVRVQYNLGLEVLCNPKLDLYKVTASGWYHGRLAGLLGHYDNELHNDLMLPETTEDFEVNKKTCKPNGNMALKPRPQEDKEGICLSLFNSSNAKFRPCFKQVDPSGFRQLCETYLSKMSVEQAARLASEQYRFVCQGQGVFISALDEFGTCGQDSDNFEVTGNDRKFQSADVVFVVEDVKCNKWAHDSLPSIVTQMDKVLNRKGFTENRYGLEGYGGVNVNDVSVRTIDGQHFGGANLFLRALETLRFPDSVGAGDLARALREVTNYPFRAGVAKVLVLAPCSKCEVSLLDSTLISNLASYGFQVHVLQDKGYVTEGFQVFGTNKERFFPAEATDFNGVLRKDRVIQENGGHRIDFCKDVAHQTGGAVFDTTHVNSKGATQRLFVKAFSSHVAMTTKLPACQECRCDANTGRTKCTLCGSNDPYFNSIPTLPEAVGALYDASHHVKNYFSNTVESAKNSLPDNYLLLGM